MGACSRDWVVGMVSDMVLVPKDLAPGDYVLSWVRGWLGEWVSGWVVIACDRVAFGRIVFVRSVRAV